MEINIVCLVPRGLNSNAKLYNTKDQNDEKNIKDDVMCFGSLNKNTNFNIWFSKSTLGYDNGLKIRIFGKKGY